MPDITIIFGNTTVEKMVLVTTLKIYNVSVSVCVCVGDGEKLQPHKRQFVLYRCYGEVLLAI